MDRSSLSFIMVKSCARLVTLLVLLIPGEALALRCGNYIIDTGDSQAKVIKYCGEPVQTERRTGIRPGVFLDRHYNSRSSQPAADRGYYIPYGSREVVVEIWILNFGPRKLMRKISFEDGIVTRVEELGYGYRD